MPQPPEARNGKKKASLSIPEPLALPGSEQILLNEMLAVHTSVRQLMALLDLLDRPENEQESLGGKLLAVLDDTRKELLTLVSRVNPLLDPATGLEPRLAALEESQKEMLRMVSELHGLLNQKVG